ncbi:mycothiol biosynthesis protein [Salinibacterium sp. dk2585]|uniref:PIG-L family deacetylase n=1 Tax=unclassified Salinibacterium TaxID=2632331 RepID=UPI0011C250E7|nr:MULTISPECIES: PIG-L family deacetylase [unclassified Salinibacterium]QEE61882.1 mycothiol biosynthesis protein [Salinibacterium sp. dk2585]TXK54563.1 mycothiol biosynthesis protein [Salinibacterium sp. dk5596]
MKSSGLPHEGVLFVHAHPDDETISTGGSIATLAQQGVEVSVLTCTRGERGEVIPPELVHLEGDGPALAAHREGELADALRALGVPRHLYLGAAGARAEGLPERRYEDSGMVEGPDGLPHLVPDASPGCLCLADFEEVVADMVAAINSTGATSVVSYDERGGYGHPDHVLAHRATREAAGRAGVGFLEVVEDSAQLERWVSDPEAHDAPDDVMLLDVTPVLDAKVDALRAHATQVTVIEREGEPVSFALSNGRVRPVATMEGLRLVDAAAGAPESGDPEPETRTSRVASSLVSLIIGLLIGVLLTINHQHRVTLGEVTIPIGLIVSLLVVGALLVGMRLVFESRLIALSTAVGVAGATALLSQQGPGGSVLVPGNVEGFVWAYAPLLISVVVLAWPKLPTRGGDRMGVQPRQEGSSL